MVTGRYSLLGIALGLGVVVVALLVALARPSGAQIVTTTSTTLPITTTTTALPAVTTTITPDTPEGRCQWERGGSVENPPRVCDDSQRVVNQPGDRLQVSAVCVAEVPCFANGQASQVRVMNTVDEPVNATAAGTPPEGWYALALIGGLCAGVAFARWALPL